MDGRKGDDALQQAYAYVWNSIFGFVSTITVGCAVELRIPEAIHNHGGEPVLVSQLVAELGIPPSKAPSLRRLMRLLSHSGFFTTSTHSSDGGEEAYLLTDRSKLLLRDNPYSLHHLSLLTLDPMILGPHQSLGAWFRGDSPSPFQHRHGASIWEMAATMPEMSGLYNEGMACKSRLLMDMLIKDHGKVFKGLRSLVDVGGGNGAVATALTEAFPSMKCTVLDLPHVVAPAKNNTCVEFLAGDVLDYIPPADAVMLKWVLHCYSDEQCVKVLKLCKDAIPPREKRGKVIILNTVMQEGGCSDEMKKALDYIDMLVLVNHSGTERTEVAWQKLFTDAGFSGYKIITTPGQAMLDIIENGLRPNPKSLHLRHALTPSSGTSTEAAAPAPATTSPSDGSGSSSIQR